MPVVGGARECSACPEGKPGVDPVGGISRLPGDVDQGGAGGSNLGVGGCDFESGAPKQGGGLLKGQPSGGSIEGWHQN
jgi:hypothetical protein